MAQKPGDRETIQWFLDFLGGVLDEITGIEHEPDTEQGTKPGGAIDAVVRIPPKRYALELTSINAYANERGENPRYTKFHALLSGVLEGRLPTNRAYSLAIPVQIFVGPMDDQDLVVRVAVAVIRMAHQFPIRQNQFARPPVVTLQDAGLPLGITLSLRRDGEPGTIDITRTAPADLAVQMDAQWTDCLSDNGPKLRAARVAESCPSLLLVTAHNHPLGNGHTYFAAYCSALARIDPSHVPDATYFVLVGHVYEFKAHGESPICRYLWPRRVGSRPAA